MRVENALYPTTQQIEALRNDPSPSPVVMLNLLKFRTRAQYPDGRKTDLTGAQAYGLYAEAMRKIVEREGGKFLFAGDVKYLPVGQSKPPGTSWGSLNIPRRRRSLKSRPRPRSPRSACIARPASKVNC